jgi:tRNA (guanine37-N1)-methyltransferase
MSTATKAAEFVVLTIFPDMFPGPLAHGVVGKALERGDLSLVVRDLREFADPPHYQVDDAPFGGGAGMVFKPEPLFRAVEAIRTEDERGARVVLLDPAGRRFDREVARQVAAAERTILVCGRYEGVDGRFREHAVDDEVSIGDYVLSGGELAAMVVVDAAARFVEGVVGEQDSVAHDSFENGLLDHPHFTRPASYRGMEVPEILLSGHHANIERWRHERARELTRTRRPDLLRGSGERGTSSRAPGEGEAS